MQIFDKYRITPRHINEIDYCIISDQDLYTDCLIIENFKFTIVNTTVDVYKLDLEDDNKIKVNLVYWIGKNAKGYDLEPFYVSSESHIYKYIEAEKLFNEVKELVIKELTPFAEKNYLSGKYYDTVENINKSKKVKI